MIVHFSYDDFVFFAKWVETHWEGIAYSMANNATIRFKWSQGQMGAVMGLCFGAEACPFDDKIHSIANTAQYNWPEELRMVP